MKVDYITGRDRVESFDKDYPFKLIRVDKNLQLNRDTFARYNEKFKLQMFLDEFKRQNPNVSTGSVILTNFVFLLIMDDEFNESQITDSVEQLKEVIGQLNDKLGNRYQINSIGLDKSLLGFSDDEFAQFVNILQKVLDKVDCQFVILLDE